MNYSVEDQAIALAGVFQAAAIVDQISRQGTVPETAFECSINSLLRNDVETVREVYGGVHGLQTGLRALSGILQKRDSSRPMHPVRYALTLLFLEAKLRKRSDLVAVIQQRLKQIEGQVLHFEPTHPNIIKAFAALYGETLSTLPQRLQVVGEPRFLKVEENADRIRATLLAGIRSAVLWQQTGGRRWKLLFKRKAMLEAVNHLARQASQES